MASFVASGKDRTLSSTLRHIGEITLQDDGGRTFKVNGYRLKIFLEPDNKEYDVINFIEET